MMKKLIIIAAIFLTINLFENIKADDTSTTSLHKKYPNNFRINPTTFRVNPTYLTFYPIISTNKLKTTESSDTPLIIAVKNNDANAVQKILQEKIDTKQFNDILEKDKYGKTALDYAQSPIFDGLSGTADDDHYDIITMLSEFYPTPEKNNQIISNALGFSKLIKPADDTKINYNDIYKPKSQTDKFSYENPMRTMRAKGRNNDGSLIEKN